MVPFEKELTFIKDDKIREQCVKVINRIPKYFYKEAASSTGKYHPDYAQGEGGLYRHTCAAVRIAQDLMSLECMEVTDEEHDWIIVALILHDSCKRGYSEIPSRYTLFDHPLKVRDFLDELMLEGVIDELFRNCVSNLVSSHMGQWNTNKYMPDVVLPKPETATQIFVHMCDYLASRKYLEVKFDE